jgi:hypothetical protein
VRGVVRGGGGRGAGRKEGGARGSWRGLQSGLAIRFHEGEPRLHRCAPETGASLGPEDAHARTHAPHHPSLSPDSSQRAERSLNRCNARTLRLSRSFASSWSPLCRLLCLSTSKTFAPFRRTINDSHSLSLSLPLSPPHFGYFRAAL